MRVSGKLILKQMKMKIGFIGYIKILLGLPVDIEVNLTKLKFAEAYLNHRIESEIERVQSEHNFTLNYEEDNYESGYLNALYELLSNN